MNRIPLIGGSPPTGLLGAYRRDRSLACTAAGVWQLHDAEGAVVRTLNSYEARFVKSTIAACKAEGERDTARLEFVIKRECSWYPNHRGRAHGTLCYRGPGLNGGKRLEAHGATMQEAIDAAMRSEL